MGRSQEAKMLKLEYSQVLGRKIRKDQPINELGINTYSRLQDLIKEGKQKETLELLDYLWIEGKGLHDLYCDWTYADLTYVAEKFGEEEVPRMLEYARGAFSKGFYQVILDLSTEELVMWFAETIRAHRTGADEKGNFSLWEEKERYAMEFDPCGSGGRIRRREASSNTRDSPHFGKTKRAHPWSWGKVGVPYYCVHCCLWHEILPIQWRGYPIKVTEYSDDPMAPCYFYFYKDPALIPEHYFTRIGKKKDPSLFKK